MRGCPDHTVAANEGLLSCNERLFRTHGSRYWGAIIMWMREERLCFANSRTPLWGGAACLHSGFFRAASAATWDPFAPASALGSPHRHGRGAWEAGLMSCPAGSTVRGMRTFSLHELITWVPKVHRWSEGRRTTLRNVILTWTLQRSSHEACPRMSES